MSESHVFTSFVTLHGLEEKNKKNNSIDFKTDWHKNTPTLKPIHSSNCFKMFSFFNTFLKCQIVEKY